MTDWWWCRQMYYSKAGMNFFGAAIYVREPGVEEVQPWYLDLVLNNDRIQDTVQAACCVEVLMKHIHTRGPMSGHATCSPTTRQH